MFRKNEGFSLVEVLVAIVVLSIIVLPIINYFANSIGIVHQSGQLSQAQDIAIDTLEIAKSKSYFYDNNGILITNSNAANELESLAVANMNRYDLFENYQIVINITNIGSINTIRKISVTISWDDNNYILESIVRIV